MRFLNCCDGDIKNDATALKIDIAEAKKARKKIHKNFVSSNRYKFFNYILYINLIILQVRENLLTQKYLEEIHAVKTEFLDPLPGYDEKKIKGKWIYEKTNPLPPHIPAIDAATCFTRIIKKDEEVIIRDRTSNKVLVAVYRNRIGPDVLELMRSTAIDMFSLRRQVARSTEIKQLNQGALTAAGYIFKWL